MKHPKARKFQKLYANIPLTLRKEIIAVINDEPLSFRGVKQELDKKTKKGYKALEQMNKLGLI